MFGPSKSLRTRVLRLALIPTILMLIAATAITYLAYQRTTQQIMREQYGQIATAAATRLSESLNGYGQILTALAQEEDIRSLKPEQERLALERWGDRLYPFDAGVAIVNAKGIIVWSQPLRLDWIGRSLADTAPFQEVKQGQSLTFSDLITSDTLAGGDVTLIGVPLLDQDGGFGGMVAGVFYMNYPQLSPIYAEVLRAGRSEQSYAYLVDRTGHVIYHPDATRVGNDVSALPVVRRTLQGESGATITGHGTTDDLVMGYSPVPATGWALIVQENWHEAVMPVRRFASFLLAALLISLLVPMALVYVGVDRITKPIAALTQGAERVAKGDFTHSVSVHSGDELQKLANQFNMMARRLSASYATLEQKVDERTKELATLNAIAARVGQSLDLDGILASVMSELEAVITVKAGGIYLLDERTGRPFLAVSQGLEAALVRAIAKPGKDDELPDCVLEMQASFTAADASTDARLARSTFRKLGAASLACVPLSAKAERLGALFMVSYAYREFTLEEMRLLSGIGHQVAIGIQNAQLFQALDRRNAELSTLNAIASIVSQSLALEQALTDALGKTLELMAAKAGEVRLLDPRTRRLIVRAQIGLPEDSRATWASVPLDGGLGELVRSGRARVIQARADFPPGWGDVKDVGTLAMVPVHAKGRVMGTLTIGREVGAAAFAPEEAELLMAIGDQLGIAAENARLFERERARANQLRIINQIGQHIASILSLNELLPFVARTLQEAFGYYNLSIYMLDSEAGELVLRACAGEYSRSLALGTRLGMAEGSAGQVARYGDPVLVPDFRAEAPYCTLDDIAASRSGIILPIRIASGVLGILEVQGSDNVLFSEMEVGHLQILADQIAVAIENARLYGESRDLATVEERTRLARELHDSVTQSLFSIVLNAEAASAYIASHPDRAQQQVQRLEEIAQEALAEMRSLIYELRPPSLGEEDLESALQRYVDVIQRRHNLHIELSASGGRRLPREYEQGLYRIAQEAIMNVVKHAQAQRVAISLFLDEGSVSLTVADDGVGFSGNSQPGADKHFGLTSMRDRAELLGGALDITSVPGEGTKVHVEIPLRNSH